MIQQTEIRFIKNPLTEQEIKQACILNPHQIKWLENLLTETAQERANLRYDPSKPIEVFAQLEAQLMGQITAYSFLLNSHIDLITELQSEDRNS